MTFRFGIAFSISRSPDVMGGAPVFAGARVPIQTLLDYLEAGESIDYFFLDFRQSVDRWLSGFSNKRKTGWSLRFREGIH